MIKGFKLTDNSTAHQFLLGIPTYKHEKHDYYLSQYDWNRVEDLRPKNMWCLKVGQLTENGYYTSFVLISGEAINEETVTTAISRELERINRTIKTENEMNKSHHNSTGELGEQLDMFEGKVSKQEEIILALFKRNPRMTASDCFRMYPDRDVPITSIRRAITNLTKSDKLVKTNDKKTGIYGRPEYFYEFKL